MDRDLGKLESILFASGETVSLKKLRKTLGISQKQLDQLLDELEKDYKSERRGIVLDRTDKSVGLKTKPTNYEIVKQTLGIEKRKNLTRASLEVLSIIAYQQPITRIEIDQIRGVNSSGTVSKLLELELIKEAGKKEVPGRPNLYQTTDLFLHRLGLKNLGELEDFTKFQE